MPQENGLYRCMGIATRYTMPMKNRWLAFALWTAVVLAAAPYANDIQTLISDRFGPRALRFGLSLLLLVLTAGFVARLIHRRGDNTVAGPGDAAGRAALGGRLAWLASLFLVAFSLMWRLRVDAEPMHLALYAILGWLAFRSFAASHRDGGAYLAAAAATAIVGTLDEVNQWLLPSRYWDLSDIGLNVSAGIMVQLVIWKVIRPQGMAAGFGPRSLRLAARLAACEALLLLLCVSNTPARIDWYATRVPGLAYLGKGRSTLMNDYGHLYADPEIGRFRSRSSPDELAALDARHGAEVAAILDRLAKAGYAQLQQEYPPSRAPFVYEAVGHLFFRRILAGRARKQSDPAAAARLATAAYRENLILERYFPQSLALSNASLPPAKRRRLEELHQPRAEFDSQASEWLLTSFSEAQARWLLLVILAVLIIAERLSCRRLKAENQE